MKTVKKDRYLSEIARDTRQLLEREKVRREKVRN